MKDAQIWGHADYKARDSFQSYKCPTFSGLRAKVEEGMKSDEESEEEPEEDSEEELEEGQPLSWPADAQPAQQPVQKAEIEKYEAAFLETKPKIKEESDDEFIPDDDNASKYEDIPNEWGLTAQVALECRSSIKAGKAYKAFQKVLKNMSEFHIDRIVPSLVGAFEYSIKKANSAHNSSSQQCIYHTRAEP